MADRVYPSSNKQPNPTATAPAAVPPPPIPTKPNPYRHPYRPNPTTAARRSQKDHRRRRFSCRRCCCLTCFWSVLLLLALLLLSAIAAAAFYVLYRPHRPLFSLTSLKLSSFNLSTTPSDDSSRLSANFSVTLSARNPNRKKISFSYGPMQLSARLPGSSAVPLSSGSFPPLLSSPENISVIHAALAANSQVLDADSVNALNSDLKRKNGLPVEIVVDTMVGVKLEKMRMRKVGIRVKCGGIHVVVPRGRMVSPAVGRTGNAKCKVDLRIKIWKWTF